MTRPSMYEEGLLYGLAPIVLALAWAINAVAPIAPFPLLFTIAWLLMIGMDR